MLVSMKKLLDEAVKKVQAIGAFNVTGLEGIQAVLQAAEEINQPVIIQFAPVHETIIPMSVIGPIMVTMAEKSSVPVCVHLDHCSEKKVMEKALAMGFSSVMYDGSILTFDENVQHTREAVELAHHYGASIEAEIGAMKAQEGKSCSSYYTEPIEAKKFVDLTQIDALACSFGTVHGLYQTKPNLDFDRIEEIHQLIHIPIVMHGGSGVSDEDIRTCINRGVGKINYYTYSQKAAGEAVRERCKTNSENILFDELMVCARKAMKEDILHAISIFSNK